MTMELIHSFNQIEFLAPVMRIDGWETALEQGSCSAISVAFADFYFYTNNHDLGHFFNVLNQNAAVLVNEQTQAIEHHQKYLLGYNFLLQQHNLYWQGNEYLPNALNHNFNKGSFALCVIWLNNTEAHTIAILSDPLPTNNYIYTFDPNFGLFRANASDWYNIEFQTFLNTHYHKIDQIAFRNIIN